MAAADSAASGLVGSLAYVADGGSSNQARTSSCKTAPESTALRKALDDRPAQRGIPRVAGGEQSGAGHSLDVAPTANAPGA